MKSRTNLFKQYLKCHYIGAFKEKFLLVKVLKQMDRIVSTHIFTIQLRKKLETAK